MRADDHFIECRLTALLLKTVAVLRLKRCVHDPLNSQIDNLSIQQLAIQYATVLIDLLTHLQLTVRDALNSALDEEMEKDSDVFIIGEEVHYLPHSLPPSTHPLHKQYLPLLSKRL